jgi:hypothetical protein
MVGQPVEISDRLRIHRFSGSERGERALGAAHHRAREMEMGGERRSAGQHEGIERRLGRARRVDLGLEPGDLRRRDAEPPVVRARPGHGDVGAEVEQVVLDARKLGIERGVRRHGARDPDRRVGLVHLAQRDDAERVFRRPRAVGERGFARISAARVDPVELDHRALRPPEADLLIHPATVEAGPAPR